MWRNVVLYDNSEKPIATLADGWWPQTAKQEGDKLSKRFMQCVTKRKERPNVGGVY